MTRKYRQRRRAERQEETRQRIARAAMELHEELGPALTTISAIAERAGVQRLTVYRHFPRERDLFLACSGLYDSMHPLPDPDRWRKHGTVDQRARAALADVYAYYSETELMLDKFSRDAPLKPVLLEVAAPMFEELQRMRQIIMEPVGIDLEQYPELNAVLTHAMDFQTWKSLFRQNALPVSSAIDLMAVMVDAALRRATNQGE